ncbi:hypothetical protein [Thermomonospora umbrina]|uniref:hypothetical protein n=1 Tax=Thermomonospora umbrina TaxID=111806 RepID=UPI001FEA63AC|nr:hypothetical protein [Thermomonospora umbrina]
MTGDRFFFDIERLEDRLVEEATLVVVAAEVEALRFGKEEERQGDELGAVGEFGVDVGQAVLELGAPGADGFELGACFLRGDCSVGGEVEQVVFACVEGL